LYRTSGSLNVVRLNTSPILGTTITFNPTSGDCYRVSAVDAGGREGPLSDPACETLFSEETISFDTNDATNNGAAGPRPSSQILSSRYQYLITVQGTFSFWPSTAWTGAGTVLCGRPEKSPQAQSSAVTNGWVGADPEANFAVPLPSGTSCDAAAGLGYPAHHDRFLIDLGAGPQHLEPLGGPPSGFAPAHRYQYLVRGQGDRVSFSLTDATTSDNYGVLTIIVALVDPTDARPAVLPRRLAVFPCMPNPFNPSTSVQYELSEPSNVRIQIADVRGRILRQFIRPMEAAGRHSVLWDGRAFSGAPAPSGVYLAQVEALGETVSVRAVLIK
jgi:hypothetical protein